MSNELSVASSIQENYSDAIITVRNSGNSLDKDLEELQERLNGLKKAKFSLNLDTKAAQRSLNALEEEYIAVRESGGVISDTLLNNLDQANEAYETMRNNLALVSKKAGEAEQSIAQYSSEANKASNKADGLQGAVLNTLASPEILKMGSEMVVNLATTWAGSAGGDEAATMLGSILSSAISGAIAGSTIGLGPGTAVGAVVGAGIGAVNGATQIFAKEDDYFKAYRNGLVDRVNFGLQGDISAGSGIAAQREMDRLLENIANSGDNVAYLSKSFEELKNNTFAGLSETVALLNQDRQNAYGEGYNAERMKSLREEANFLRGEDGERAQEADKAIGAYYASLDNKRDELRRAEESAAYKEIEEKGLARDGAEAGRILMEARARAEAQYNASTEAQNEFSMQTSVIKSVSQMLVESDLYWDAGYSYGIEQSKGMEAALKDYTLALRKEAVLSMAGAGERSELGATDWPEWVTLYGDSEKSRRDFEEFKRLRAVYAEEDAGKHAYGLSYVPYDNFPAFLHEGEQVLTAGETRKNGAGGVTIPKLADTLVVREEADIYKIAQEVAREITNAQMLS